mmetsp:Transcript_316/g.781  ORF Transcript_316/g.781 Transcript_316/m.781 type:complete len:253 (-) Transcript_316:253-1011(-)
MRLRCSEHLVTSGVSGWRWNQHSGHCLLLRLNRHLRVSWNWRNVGGSNGWVDSLALVRRWSSRLRSSGCMLMAHHTASSWSSLHGLWHGWCWCCGRRWSSSCYKSWLKHCHGDRSRGSLGCSDGRGSDGCRCNGNRGGRNWSRYNWSRCIGSSIRHWRLRSVFTVLRGNNSGSAIIHLEIKGEPSVGSKGHGIFQKIFRQHFDVKISSAGRIPPVGLCCRRWRGSRSGHRGSLGKHWHLHLLIVHDKGFVNI